MSNLTVSLKIPTGQNPSDGDPLYVRIGNKTRKVTKPLSVARNARTNWFNADMRWYERIPIIGTWFWHKRHVEILKFYYPYGRAETYVNGKLCDVKTTRPKCKYTKHEKQRK